MRITRADGLIDGKQAAELCGVKETTIWGWVNRGHLTKAGIAEDGRSLYDPVAVARAELATRKHARRVITARAA